MRVLSVSLSKKLKILNFVKIETNELGQVSTRMDATYILAQTILYHVFLPKSYA